MITVESHTGSAPAQQVKEIHTWRNSAACQVVHESSLARPLAVEIAIWLGIGVISGAIAIAGASFGHFVIKSEDPPGFLQSLSHIDGNNYRSIIEHGYAYQEGSPSLVAFFPGYPLAVRWFSKLSGVDTIPSQLIISNGCCLLAFALMGAYLRQRRLHQSSIPAGLLVDAGAEQRDVNSYALLAMGLLPTTFFFRMGYSESLFLCIGILTLFLLLRNAPPILTALVIGLGTAVRPVGVALLLPFVLHIWNNSRSRSSAIRQLSYIVPVACWGLLAYMTFQYIRFHEPFAFALTQKYHRMRPVGTFAEQFLGLLTWEPIRDVYNPASSGYWHALHAAPSRLASLEFANPIYLLGTAVLIAWGHWKRWLTRYETLLAAALLLMSYFTRAYEMRMLSQARFASVVFPVYIVLGQLLARLPAPISGSLLALSGFLMGMYAALFAAGRPFL